MEPNIIDNKIDLLGLSWYNTYFWKYQYKLSKEYIIPYLKFNGFDPKGKTICEIGSAEGGVLFAFAVEGAKLCVATDIAQSRLEAGEKIAKEFNISINFEYHNIIKGEIPNNWKEAFDIIILRDVIEHLEDTKTALRKIKEMLKVGGIAYITFPPYYSPFGGHQHQIQNVFRKCPYLHWLPKPIFKLFLKKGRPADVEEVLRLKEIKLTIDKFLKLVTQVGLKVQESEFFIIRPVYKYKFGLKPLRLPKLRNFRIIKEIFATEASFILVKK